MLKVARACADADLELVVGGSVAPEALPALREIRQVRLDRFETRKIVFGNNGYEYSATLDEVEAFLEAQPKYRDDEEG